MINPHQFRQFVIEPALGALEPNIPYSRAAENLLLATALVESQLHWLHQVNGPALGLLQIEPATHADIWANYLDLRPSLHGKIRQGFGFNGHPGDAELITNLAYAVAIARVDYFRARDPMPPENDAKALYEFYKKIYNTAAGAAEEATDLPIFQKVVHGGEYGV